MSVAQTKIKTTNKGQKKMMTRKDYVETANILNAKVDLIDFTILADIAEDFAEMFANDNPRFDHQRFIDAVFAEKENN